MYKAIKGIKLGDFRMLNERSNTDILRELDKLVIGHEKAKKLLITLVNRSKMAHAHKYGYILQNRQELEKMNLLLIGASGTGKTFLLESLQKVCHFPLVKIDASRLNPAANQSYSHKDIEKAIRRNAIKVVADESLPYFSVQGAIDQTVVFVDEVDKLCTPFGKNDGWHTRTQSELLTLVENQEDFKHVSFVFAGAFSSLREPKKTTSIGFSSSDVGEIKEKTSISEKEIIEYGLMTEMFGRITAFNELDVLTHETMLTILDDVLLPEKLAQLSAFIDNPTKAITNTMKDELIEEALSSGQGVRHMKRKLNTMFLDMEFSYEQHKQLMVT